MKNLVLIIGALLIALNTAAGLIVSDYGLFNYLTVDASLALSAAILYWLAVSTAATGFKIGLTVLFFFTGLARMVCLIVAPSGLKDNHLLLYALGILIFEAACLATVLVVGQRNG
jgi:hypothetical protein